MLFLLPTRWATLRHAHVTSVFHDGSHYGCLVRKIFSNTMTILNVSGIRGTIGDIIVV